MAANSPEILHDFSPMIRVYKDGRVERLLGKDIVAASVDPETGTESKDVQISPELNISARLYLPKTPRQDKKLPLLVYFHGGGFVVESAFSPPYHTHLNAVVAEAGVVAVSINYRLAPEHPLPTAYEDSWIAVKWVASHSNGQGPEVWLRDYVDFDSVFFGGDSAGGNLAHNMALRVGLEKLDGFNLDGIFLNCPYFWGKEAIGVELKNLEMKAYVEVLWHYIHPKSAGADDPLVNPVMEPNLSRLGCKRVLVYVAEKDILKERGWIYKEALEKSEWGGDVEVVEVAGENHVFNLFFPKGENALSLLKKLAAFINNKNDV
ncbi:unnamed protein product [Coffea canephora]|uniref:Alpha/beta hydrolase fold-3 domain-containing protein n=2 Tax=Coffea TaxID=13442 RepID=A0A068TMI6_COFCA|nr:probable carboxylesterase 7 [Coffea arabica]CDO97159.1 unnamed protein product [Coffea canephora]